MNKFNYFLKAVLCLAMTAGMLCACEKDSVDSGKKDIPQEYLMPEKDTLYFMSAAATDRILS